MSIEEFHSHFEGIDLQKLKEGGSFHQLSELEKKVSEFSKNIPQNLTKSDIAGLKDLAGRISTECAGTNLARLFQHLMHGISYDYPAETALLFQTAPRPVNGGNRLDPEQMTAWVNAHSGANKGAAAALSRTVHCISQKEFERSLGKALYQLNTVLPKGTQYQVGIEKGKSNLWVGQLAMELDILHTIPVGAIPLAFNKGTCPNNVVLFDDASISGEQMERIIRQFITRSKDEGTPLENLYIVIPYMTANARNRLQAIPPTEGGPHIHFITAQNLPTISEALAAKPDELKTLNSLLAPKTRSSIREKDLLPQTNSFSITQSLSATFFAHKVPDPLSFPPALQKGAIMRQFGRQEEGRYQPIHKENSPYKEGISIQPIAQAKVPPSLNTSRVLPNTGGALPNISEEE